MKTPFLHFIKEKDLIRNDERILLAFSGGMDSVVLAKLFSEAKIEFAIAHCNFQLRGDESEGDEEFSKKVAIKYKVPFYSIRFSTKSISKKTKRSVQETARDLRYEWFEKIRAEYNFQKIATAHHLSDSIETFFINSIRGSGLAGLKGIPVKNNHIVRPLLFATRDEIEKYAKTNKLKWREDSSNSSDDYLRNRIRHQVIPLLKKEHPELEQSMNRSLAMFDFAHRLQKLFIDDWNQKHIRTSEEGFLIIPLKEVDKAGNPEALLSAILYSFGITNIDVKKLLNASPGKVFTSKSYNLLYDRDQLILRTTPTDKSAPLLLTNLPDRLKIGDTNYQFTRLNAAKMEGIPRIEEIQAVSADRLKFPLTIRRWKDGDFFYPLGMEKRKKISDFLIDKKVNRFQKEMVFVLLSGNDIVCIFGHRIDNRFKITNETTSVLHIERIYE